MIHPPQFSPLLERWRALTQPLHPSPDPEQHRLASLAASLSLAVFLLILVLAPAIVVAQYAAGIAATAESLITTAALLLLLLTYFLSRQGRYQTSIFLLIAGGTLLILLAAETGAQGRDTNRLDYLIATLLLGVIFLSPKWALLLTIVQLVGVYLYCTFVGTQPLRSLADGPFPFLLVTSLLTLVVIYHRTLLDRFHHGQIDAEVKRYRAIAVNVADMIIEMDTDWRITYANPAIAQIGLSPDRIVGQPYTQLVEQLVMPESQSELGEPLRQSIEQMQPVSVRFQLRLPSGMLHWYEAQINPLRADGRWAGCISVSRDMTQQALEIEQRLRENDERYQQMMGTLSDHIYIYQIDAQGQTEIIYKSGNAYRMLGHPVENYQRDFGFWLSLIHPDDRAAAEAQFVEIAAGRDSECVYRMRRADDCYIWVRDSALVKTDPDSSVRTVYGIVSNITALKEAELALRTNEERYRIISEMISDYAYAFTVEQDGSLKLEWVTDSFERVTSYTPDTFGHDGLLEHVITDDIHLIRKHLKTMFDSNQPTQSEYRIRTRSGEIRWLSVYRRPVWDEQQGRVTRFFGAAKDITEQKKAEQNSMALALERERLSILSGLVRNLSHDLRTPLSVVGTSADLIRRKLDQPNRERAERHLHAIEEQIMYLDRQLGSLLSVTRFDDGQQMRTFTAVSLNTVIKAILREQEKTVQDNRQRVHVEAAPDLPFIFGDVDEIQRAIAHIIMNAITYTPDGGHINIETGVVGDQVRLTVHDNGIGIDPNDLPHIFEPLYRADRARQSDRGGMGLGLSVVKMVIEAHGGSVAVQSQPGQGTSVTVTLPAAPMRNS
jgi:PAS domain S-box-containing protein